MSAIADLLSTTVASAVSTETAGASRIRSFTAPGIVPATAPPPASNSPEDKLSAEIARAVAIQSQATQLILAHKGVKPQLTGRLNINFVLDTTSDVKWADNPNHVKAEAVLAGVKAAAERRIRLPSDLTIMINVGWTRCAGNPMTGALGQSMWFITPASKTDLLAAFAKLPLNSVQREAFDPANLESLWPLLNGQDLQTTFALAAMLGLAGWNDAGARTYLSQNLCGWIGLGGFDWDYSPDGTTNTTGGFSMYDTIMHELWEVLGRACGGFLGDLVAWMADKIRNIQLGVGRRYVSTNGKVAIAEYNQQAGGDYGDLVGPPDPFTAWTGPGNASSRSPTLPGTATDWLIITLLGICFDQKTLQDEGIAP